MHLRGKPPWPLPLHHDVGSLHVHTRSLGGPEITVDDSCMLSFGAVEAFMRLRSIYSTQYQVEYGPVSPITAPKTVHSVYLFGTTCW
jgi:hypothetical protein